MQTKKALEGVKIADFTWVAVGPTTINYLGDFGATVVRVETHSRPDPARCFGPFKGKPSVDSTGFFTHHNTSKYSMSLNLTKPKGKETAIELIKWADIVSESMTPGAMHRLGLGYEDVIKYRPDIVYYSTCMNGQTGPRAADPGYGQLASALGGVYYLTGWPDRPPATPKGAYTDYVAPRFGALAILAALDYRRRTGKGQHIDLSQVETAAHFVAPTVMDYVVNGRTAEREGNRAGCAAPHAAFPCQGQDRWCAIAVFNDQQWQALCQVIGNPAWTKRAKFSTILARKKNEDELEKLVGQWTSQHTAEDVETLMQQAGVPAHVVETNADLFDDPQLKHRGHFRRFEHAVLGNYAHSAPAIRMSKTPDSQFGAPLIGQHNEFVLKEILHKSDDEVAELLIEGALTTDADLPPIW